MNTRLVLMYESLDSGAKHARPSGGRDSCRGMTKLSGLLLIWASLLLPLASFASEEGQEHRHHLAVFIGATHAEGEDEPTVGVDYEYRLTQKIGVGALVDHAGGDLDSTIIAAALFIRPHEGWLLLAAAGNENTDHGDEFIARAGIGYEFGFHGGWSLTPQLNFDYVDDEETKEVFGVNIGRSF